MGAEHVEHVGGTHCRDHLRIEQRRSRGRRPLPKLLRAGQVGVAPRGGFRGVSQLLEGIGRKQTGLGVGRIRVDHVPHHFGHPAILALRVVRPRLGNDGRCTAEVLDVLLRGRRLGQRIQIRRVGVIPAQVLLIHGLGVVGEGAVIAACSPVVGEAGRQHQLFRDLGRGVAVVHQPHALVVNVAVQIALVGNGPRHAVAPPRGPVVLRDEHVGVRTEPLERGPQMF